MTKKDNCRIIALMPDNLNDMEYTKIPFDGYEYVSNITDNPWLMPYGVAIALTHAAQVTVCNGENPNSNYKIIATLAPKIVYI